MSVEEGEHVEQAWVDLSAKPGSTYHSDEKAEFITIGHLKNVKKFGVMNQPVTYK